MRLLGKSYANIRLRYGRYILNAKSFRYYAMLTKFFNLYTTFHRYLCLYLRIAIDIKSTIIHNGREYFEWVTRENKVGTYV